MARPARVRLVETGSFLEDLRLDQALARFDRARTADEARAAKEQVLALGREAVPAALGELAKPQSPERFDVLLALLLRRVTADEVLVWLRESSQTWVLRAALAEVLGHFAGEVHAADASVRERIAAALAPLLRDPNAGVRIAAVDAIDLGGLVSDPHAFEALRTVAAQDPTPSVKQEAERVLDEAS